jgi:hypothetical protein
MDTKLYLDTNKKFWCSIAKQVDYRWQYGTKRHGFEGFQHKDIVNVEALDILTWFKHNKVCTCIKTLHNTPPKCALFMSSLVNWGQ